MAQRIQSFEEFWPFYLGEHSKPATRWFHFAGTTLALGDIALAVAFRNPVFLIYAPIAAYGFAWVSHFFVEKNRPATFSYPLWSLLGDLKMYGMMWSGRLGGELARFRIGAVGAAQRP